MSAYSFQDVSASAAGPGLAVMLGSGAETAEEGISIVRANNKNTMTIGADGAGVHNLRADDSGTVTVTLLKTSPMNAVLMAAYNLQQSSSLLWGRNTITINDLTRGDATVARKCAFQKVPDLNYATEAGTVQWVFESLAITSILGVGVPDLL